MNFETLKNFIAIVDYGSVSKAADALHVDSSSLTRQLRQLEQEEGELFKATGRSRYGQQLTDRGRNFHKLAQRILELQAIYKEDALNNILRMVVAPGISLELYQNYLLPLSQCHPGLSFNIQEISVAQQEQAILQETAELGLSNSSLIHPDSFKILCSRPMPYYIVCNRNTIHIDIHSTYTLKDLKDVPLCLTINSAIRIEEAFKKHNIIPRVVCRNTMRQTSIFNAKLDMGITIYPLLTPPLDESLVAIPLEDPSLSSAEILYTQLDAKLSTIAQEFVELYTNDSL